GRRATQPGRRRRAPAQVLPGRSGRAGVPRRWRDLLAAVLAPGSGWQSLLAGRDRGGRGADSGLYRDFRPLGRDAPVRRRGTAGARRVRGPGAVAARRRALPAGRARPPRAPPGAPTGPGRGTAPVVPEPLS